MMKQFEQLNIDDIKAMYDKQVQHQKIQLESSKKWNAKNHEKTLLYKQRYNRKRAEFKRQEREGAKTPEVSNSSHI